MTQAEDIGRAIIDAHCAWARSMRRGGRQTMAPYGYINAHRGDRKFVVPDPSEQCVLQLIQTYAEGGWSCSRISLALNAGEIRTRRGFEWTALGVWVVGHRVGILFTGRAQPRQGHGSRAEYRRGCRCSPCCIASAEYQRAGRASRKAGSADVAQ